MRASKLSQIGRLKAKNALLKKAVRAFVDGYPCREWEGILHESGCPGTHLRKDERQYPDEVCECDGDHLTALVKRALR
jgi:hypothetical protein